MGVLWLTAARLRRPDLLVGVVLALAFTVGVAATRAVGASSECDVNATTETFTAALEGANAGETLCLADGDYGIFHGTDKPVTIAAADDSAPQMLIDLGAGDTGFVLRGMTGMGGLVADGATNVTIEDSAFTSTLDVSGATTRGIVLDGNTHNWMVESSETGANAKIYLQKSLSGTLDAPAVTISDSEIENGDLDGIHFGGGSGYQIVGNELANLCQKDVNHTDNLQFDTTPTSQVRIARNYIHAAQDCPSQGITSYDAGTDGVIIEDNVVDVPRDWGIELYSDRNSIVRHNTVVWHDKAYSMFDTETGQITIDHKDGDPASTGTEVYDNIATRVNLNGDSTGTVKNNVNGRRVRFVGPTGTFGGFKLASKSRAGRRAATDGLDAGVRTTQPRSDR